MEEEPSWLEEDLDAVVSSTSDGGGDLVEALLSEPSSSAAAPKGPVKLRRSSTAKDHRPSLKTARKRT